MVDELVLLLLRSDDKRAAIMMYVEETDTTHAKAVRAVEELARKHGIVTARSTPFSQSLLPSVFHTHSAMCT